MVNYELSKRAEIDMAEIYEYGIFQFGLNQADNYLDEMEAQFEMLYDRPELRRKAFDLRKNLYRFKYESHVIFFHLIENQAFVLRVLGGQMDFKRHFK